MKQCQGAGHADAIEISSLQSHMTRGVEEGKQMLGNKKTHGKPCETIDTLIGQETEVNGDVSFSGGLRVDGKVKGNVTAGDQGNGTLVVSELGEIDGSVNVPYLIVNGTVKGKINSHGRVELQSNARVMADIHYQELEMTLGASVNGSMVCESGKPAATLKSVPAGEAAKSAKGGAN